MYILAIPIILLVIIGMSFYVTICMGPVLSKLKGRRRQFKASFIDIGCLFFVLQYPFFAQQAAGARIQDYGLTGVITIAACEIFGICLFWVYGVIALSTLPTNSSRKRIAFLIFSLPLTIFCTIYLPVGVASLFMYFNSEFVFHHVVGLAVFLFLTSLLCLVNSWVASPCKSSANGHHESVPPEE